MPISICKTIRVCIGGWQGSLPVRLWKIQYTADSTYARLLLANIKHTHTYHIYINSRTQKWSNGYRMIQPTDKLLNSEFVLFIIDNISEVTLLKRFECFHYLRFSRRCTFLEIQHFCVERLGTNNTLSKAWWEFEASASTRPRANVSVDRQRCHISTNWHKFQSLHLVQNTRETNVTSTRTFWILSMQCFYLEANTAK